MPETTCWRSVVLPVLTVGGLFVLGSCRLPVRAPESTRVSHPQRLAQGKSSPQGESELEPGPTLSADSTLDAYRLYAVANNPNLEGLYHQWRAQMERAPQVRALPEPRLSYAEFLVPVQTRAGPQERKFALSQTLPWFGKLGLRGSIEEEAAKASWQRFSGAQLAVDHRMRSTYAEYYYLGKSVSITRENLDLLRRIESVARKKLAAGAENHRDIIRLQVEMGRLEDRLNTLLDMRTPLRAKLNAILNRRGDTDIPWPAELPEAALALDDSTLFRYLEENNPELLALQHEIERQSLATKLAKKEYFPDIAVGVETIVTGSALAPNIRDSGDGDDAWALTFSTELPIWFQKYGAGEREAKERRYAAKKKHEGKQNDLRAELDLALYHLRDSERKVSLYRNTLIPKAQESLRAMEAAFRADAVDFLDLVDSQRVLLEFQLSRERALSDRLRAEAGIDRLVGRFAILPPAKGEED